MPQFETNRLVHETSPYLLQHSHNPVDWYPWGQEAFQKAEAENKPIFLSVGYSACHWCHVMERESFEDHAIASIMNDHFINIKVDREERPDIDDIYMSFVQLTSGSGGWPMSVFLTPDRKPFFGGTYFPPRDAYGRPGFPSILMAVADAWKNDREKVVQSADSVSERLAQFFTINSDPTPFRNELFERAAKELLDRFDPIDGGFGGAPKFPPSFGLSMLMRHYTQTGNSRELKAVTFTLDKMARGGIFDQIGGGLHRYSVDSQWLVPHFEKMLYDNALMAVVYFEAYQLTQSSLYLETAKGILDFVLREMTDDNGGFHSSLDADSEGKEGEFYVWTPEQIIEVLGSHDGKLFCDYYDVTNSGNFEHGKSILHVRVIPDEFAESYKISVGELNNRLAGMRNKLLQAREKRHRPAKDDKVLTDWNSLMISAMARGYQVTHDSKYLHAAKRSAEFVLTTMYKDERLSRVYRRGVIKGNGFLTDYSYFTNALLDLFESDFDSEWLLHANSLAQRMIGLFSDSNDGGFFMTLPDQADVLVRQKDNYDNATPSGSSMAVLALLRLARFSENKTLFELAEKSVASLVGHVERTPAAYLNLLNVCEYMVHPAAEIVLVGQSSNQELQKMLNLVHGHYIPNRLLISYDQDGPRRDALAMLVPFLKTLPRVDGAAAFVCENYSCKLPVTTAEDLASELAGKMKSS